MGLEVGVTGQVNETFAGGVVQHVGFRRLIAHQAQRPRKSRSQGVKLLLHRRQIGGVVRLARVTGEQDTLAGSRPLAAAGQNGRAGGQLRRPALQQIGVAAAVVEGGERQQEQLPVGNDDQPAFTLQPFLQGTDQPVVEDGQVLPGGAMVAQVRLGNAPPGLKLVQRAGQAMEARVPIRRPDCHGRQTVPRGEIGDEDGFFVKQGVDRFRRDRRRSPPRPARVAAQDVFLDDLQLPPQPGDDPRLMLIMAGQNRAALAIGYHRL